MAPHRVYRACTLLYPRSFRRRYGPDLVQHHAEHAAHKGLTAAWMRSGLDLLVTVPRYRLESLVHSKNPTPAITIIAALIAVASASAVVDGLPGASVFLFGALAVGFAQRSQIARALHVAGPGTRRRRLRLAGLLALASILVVVVAAADLANEDSWGARAIIYNIAFVLPAVGSVATLLVGLATPRDLAATTPDRAA